MKCKGGKSAAPPIFVRSSMISIRPGLILILIWAMAAFCAHAMALEFVPQPITGGTYRFKDCNGQVFGASYIQQYSYANAQVKVTLDPAGAPYLAGLIQAAGLKPNFAYQIKLGGRNSKLNPAGGGDDATNERLGLQGRWWRAYPNPANAKDDDYFAHKDDPNYAYSGYLIIGFFITDAQGGFTGRFEGDNSFHVLWRTSQRTPSQNDGPIFNFVLPATAGNPAYDMPFPALPMGIYGEWEPTRALPGTLAMTKGHYACDFILTEESFHDSGANAGNWTAALGAPIEFDIGVPTEVVWNNPADIVYPAPLSAVQLNATAPEPGQFSYSPPLGTVLNAGSHTLSMQFTPGSTGVIQPPVFVQLNVQKGNPHVAWNPPKNIRANMPLDDTILNAVADAPGQLVYYPPFGTWVNAGPLTLTVQFFPNDRVNYTVPNLLKFDVEAVTGLLITSGPWAAPAVAFAGWPVQFGAATEARGIAWSWDFGDGTAAATGAVTSHAFAAPGIYTAKVTAQVPGGRSESESLGVTILPAPDGLSSADGGGDADGDGFSNALELAWGSNPNLAGSTPLDGVNALAPLAMRVSKLNVRLAGSPGGRYRIEMKAFLSVPKTFNPAAMRLGIFACGIARAVALDEFGRARIDGASVTTRLNPVAGNVRTLVVETSMDGSYGDLNLPGELAGPYDEKILRDMTAMIVLGGNVYAGKVKLTVKNTGRSVIYNAVK